jgi:hypothetical protein
VTGPPSTGPSSTGPSSTGPSSRVRAAGLLALLSMLPGTLLGFAGCARSPRPDAFVRVDQVGYLAGETKIAMLLAPRDATGATATVVDAGGRPVLTAAVGRSRGRWNATYSHVQPIDLTRLTRAGTYRVRITGAVSAESPPFRVGTGAALFGGPAENAVGYFQAHRDGADQVAGPWRRPPAHLADRQATLYDPPSFHADGSVRGAMTPIGGPIDVEGGWYDAGDYLKFTHTTAYALILMLLMQRDGLAPAGLAAESRHGLAWLDHMWDARSATLYTQVGIGSGRDFLGDHDTWRLPQADDRLAVTPGDQSYYQRYRPVFRAAPPGARISPNLAGRVAAAFALAAQVEAAGDPDLARRHLSDAAQIFGLADTTDARPLVTTEPQSFYPEDSWHDDLAAAATELSLAGRLLHDPREQDWARQATHWARANADDGGTDPISVYDLSAVADTDLTRRLTEAALPSASPPNASPPSASRPGASRPGAEIGVEGLRGDLRRRLDAGVRAAAGNPMGAAAGDGGSDYAATQLGYAVTAELYRRMTGDPRYAAFGTAQRAVALGANGWGTSFVIGAGSTYPRCPHDQIADLTRESGTAPTMAGAVVNGPNAYARVRLLVRESPPHTCRAGTFAAFDRPDDGYTNAVGVSANTEPAIDFTATGMYAFALAAARH